MTLRRPHVAGNGDAPVLQRTRPGAAATTTNDAGDGGTHATTDAAWAATTATSGTMTATSRATTATCCGAPARATDGKRGSRGGRRAHVARPCGRPASADEDERLSWALSSFFFFFFCFFCEMNEGSYGLKVVYRVVAQRPAQIWAGAYHSPMQMQGTFVPYDHRL